MFDFNSIYVFCNYLLTGFFNGTPDSLHPLQTSAVSTFQKKSALRLVRTKPIYKKLPFAFWLRNALHNSWEEGCNERGSMQKGRCTNNRAIKRYKRNILSWSCRISFSPFFNLKGTIYQYDLYLNIFSSDELNWAVAPSHEIKIDSKRASPAEVTSKDSVTNAVPATQ